MSRGHLLAFAPVFLFASSHAVAALPDHFGISVGVLTATYGVFLLHEAGRLRRILPVLAVLAVLAAGVCLTNAILPLALAGESLRRTYWPGPGRHFYATTLTVLALGFIATVTAVERYGEHAPLAWQARYFLNLRVVKDPPAAATRFARAWVEPVVGPAPAVDTNNFYAKPMLTYEPRFAEYALWPWDGVGSVAAACWLGLLAMGIVCGLRAADSRPAVVAGTGWAAWNGLFHNVWGDEFFLYSPHFGWSLWATAVLGCRGLDRRWLALPCAAVAVGGLWTLTVVRGTILGIET